MAAHATKGWPLSSRLLEVSRGCNANADQRTKVFGVRLPEALINQVKIAAAQQRISVQGLVTEVVTKYLGGEKKLKRAVRT
jgi:predicted HicB family RNase H-like nuclease